MLFATDVANFSNLMKTLEDTVLLEGMIHYT